MWAIEDEERHIEALKTIYLSIVSGPVSGLDFCHFKGLPITVKQVYAGSQKRVD